ncbi:universal stress protein UspA [Halobellus salinus]|uniref:Universal stress protein UspA n=1 Tax=Halobellus salinus TaxID=931585 RepID=A0A830EUA1_9EURY|nr:universal stress protein [Halobellus salinus]GGJ10569.1 universal stress protein UspA [Halobellus salinus]SMP09902.1 Nucleotide-binding universal stress protein, UspA family [Halobellus salinus]
MYDRILVPTDGSECAERATDHATGLAAGSDATLHALSVVDATEMARTLPAVNAAHVERELRSRAESVVATVTARAADAGIETVAAVEAGIPSRDIVAYAVAHDCDLTVMGTHGRAGPERYLLGSAAERTARRSDVPVVTLQVDAAGQA